MLSGSLAELKKHVLPTDYPELSVDDIKVYLIEGSSELLGSMSSQASTKAEGLIVHWEVMEAVRSRLITSPETLQQKA